MYIVVKSVRRLAKDNGKRVGRSFLEYLNRRVERIILTHVKISGGRVTLTCEDAEALDAFNTTKP